MCEGSETSCNSYYTVAGTLPSKENQIFTGGDVIVCLKSKGVSFLFKNTFLRLESKVLHQFFFRFDVEIPTSSNYVFDLDSFTVY